MRIAPGPLSHCDQAVIVVWLVIVLVGSCVLAHEPFDKQTPTQSTVRFLTPEIMRNRTVGQIVTPQAHAFNRIVIEAQAVSSNPRGEVVFEVYEAASLHLVRRVSAPVARVVRHSTFSIEFRPIDGSRLRQYRLRVSMPDTDPGEGVSLWAYDGRVGDDALIVNGTHAFSELAFSTGSEGVWRRLLRYVGGGRFGVPDLLLLVGLVILGNLAVFMLFRSLMCGELASIAVESSDSDQMIAKRNPPRSPVDG